MADNRFTFTKAKLDAVALPAVGKRDTYYDGKVRGLALRVTHTGVKTFVVYRRVAGVVTRVLVGPYPDLTIDQARTKAEEINGAVALGDNPRDKAKLVLKAVTLGDLFDGFLEGYAKIHKKSWQADVWLFNKYLGDWRDRKLVAIAKPDVRERHAKIGRDSGLIAANRVLAFLACVFRFGINHDLYRGDLPTAGIKPFPERQRERRLLPEEAPAFLKALADDPNPDFSDFVLTALCTGARKGNVLAMRWDQLDLVRGMWRIPETKNGTPQTVPLAGPVVGVLERRRADATGPWVFPGKGGASHLKEPKRAWASFVKRANLGDFRIHDLRRTLASWMVDNGTSLAVVGKALNHKTAAATTVYARVHVEPVRAGIESATGALMEAGQLKARA